MRAESTSGDSGDKESISPTGPEDMMKRYYQLISERRYDEAYAMRSSRTTSSRDEFIDAWKNNISISPEIESVSPIDGSGNEALAVCRLHSVDYDNNKDSDESSTYRASIRLLFEDGNWRYNGGDFQKE